MLGKGRSVWNSIRDLHLRWFKWSCDERLLPLKRVTCYQRWSNIQLYTKDLAKFLIHFDSRQTLFHILTYVHDSLRLPLPLSHTRSNSTLFFYTCFLFYFVSSFIYLSPYLSHISHFLIQIIKSVWPCSGCIYTLQRLSYIQWPNIVMHYEFSSWWGQPFAALESIFILNDIVFSKMKVSVREALWLTGS